MNSIYAEQSISVTELKRNYASILATVDAPIAVLNHNKPEAYLIPADYFERMMIQLEDMELNMIAERRKDDKLIQVSIDDL
ncbi:prevent-host-death protein [Pelistega indica]|uniref:Antitoxin n=1 Tax=Pelistega indica TaxID=1414851 RepID=V8FQH3_9BURK|nr:MULTISPECIES: type II toxin-antitoxin system prevent-host-death family antitoxin [Pelistega]ETD66539.1 prevent-host-death protein [Pelistega indica]